MVLDIRHLRSDAGDDERSAAPAAAKVAAAGAPSFPAVPADTGATEAGPDLDALLTELAEGDAAASRAAAEALRVLVPSDDGIEVLCAIVESDADPRRLAAAQVLGRHRKWLASRTQLERAVAWARRETDPGVAAALAWLLRGRDVLQAFLLHPMNAMSREAALGVPMTAATVDGVLDALLVGRSPEVDRILAHKLQSLHPELAARAVERLLEVADRVTGDAVGTVLAHLPQRPLFELFVEGQGRPAWTAQPTDADTARSQRWHRLARQASQALLAAPSAELVRYLVNRSAADDTFARRHAEFMQTAMANTREVIGAEMLDDLERLTVHATEDRLERMARLLMDLGDKIAGGESHLQVADLLERWKSRSPALKLKIFHLQQGLK